MSESTAEMALAPADPKMVTVPETREIVMAPPEVCFPMSHREWGRLRKRIGEMVDPISNASNIASICVGVAAGSILQLATWVPAYVFLPATAQPWFSWVAPFFVILALATGVLAAYMYRVESRVERIRKRDAALIAEDMDAMYERYRLNSKTTTPPALPQSPD